MRNHQKYIVALFLFIYFILVLRSAWMCDDAFITLRTVRNFVNGYGLTWNIVERVQAYTAPLWLFVLSAVYWFTREPYYSVIFVSIFFAILNFCLIGFCIAKSSGAATVACFALILSKSFIDYSTSGLENALTYFLVSLFFFVYFTRELEIRTLFYLSFIAALGILNRMDIALIYLPSLLITFFKLRSLKGLKVLFWGVSPLIAWEFFSLFYYGYLFPNTVYAKLSTGMTSSALMMQGLAYYLNLIKWDQLTFYIILLAIALPFMGYEKKLKPLSFGILLYLVYILRIGGDFMSGRFFAAPFLCAAIIISRQNIRLGSPVWWTSFIAIGLIGLTVANSPLYIDTNFYDVKFDQNKIADERLYYYSKTGLMKAPIGEPWPSIRHGISHSEKNNYGMIVNHNIGMRGFYATEVEPETYILDDYALSDPLLSRLPAIPGSRIGHFERIIPVGYIDSIGQDKNLIIDPSLARYYDKILIITRGKIFSLKRLCTILNMNLGRYSFLKKEYIDYKEIKIIYSEINIRKKEGTKWDAPGNIFFSQGSVLIDLQKISYAENLEISLDHNDVYRLEFIRNQKIIATIIIPSKIIRGGGLAVYRLNVPGKAVKSGYDNLAVIAVKGDCKYSLGHLILFEG
jgi:arabinofuranosyltransferase